MDQISNFVYNKLQVEKKNLLLLKDMRHAILLDFR